MTAIMGAVHPSGIAALCSAHQGDHVLVSQLMEIAIKGRSPGKFRLVKTDDIVGQARLIRMGFRQGSKAGFGLRRLLVDQDGRPKGILSSYEYKSLQTDRIVLALGPADEIATVRWIFGHFARTRKTELETERRGVGIQDRHGGEQTNVLH
ncbi:hypothetical protein [Mesorhizobium jarvisii]|uniref:hypothetical protein n=1 Tax=Mesorhizobium jarvisii TaxID=1777867 RepID=UPI001F0A8D04|nr:hypothetical protein [Mesorhizobium jarvisii]MCH4558880.1 hypothetical protein [Mesorhizobium jarvisii]